MEFVLHFWEHLGINLDNGSGAAELAYFLLLLTALSACVYYRHQEHGRDGPGPRPRR